MIIPKTKGRGIAVVRKIMEVLDDDGVSDEDDRFPKDPKIPGCGGS